jgi:hypothetical protein
LVDRLTSRIQNTPNGKGEIVSTAAPTEAEREVLEGRRNAIADVMEPGREQEIEKRAAYMLGCFSGPERDPVAVRGLVRTIARELKNIPIWAIDEACARILGGRAPGINRAFAPQPPQIAHLCREIVQPLHAERARIAKVLNAEIFVEATPEERERVAAGLLALRDDLKAAPDEDWAVNEELKKSFAEWDEKCRERELRSKGIADGFKMSLALRTKLGIVDDGVARTREIEAMQERRMLMEDYGEDPGCA